MPACWLRIRGCSTEPARREGLHSSRTAHAWGHFEITCSSVRSTPTTRYGFECTRSRTSGHSPAAGVLPRTVRSNAAWPTSPTAPIRSPIKSVGVRPSFPPSRRFRAGERSLEQVASVLGQQIGDRLSQVFALADPSAARERLELCEPFAIQPKHHRAQSRLRHPLSLTLTHMVPRRAGTARKITRASTNEIEFRRKLPPRRPDRCHLPRAPRPQRRARAWAALRTAPRIRVEDRARKWARDRPAHPSQ